jgi:hypothetical protein
MKMAMEEISIEQAKEIARKKGLKPGRVRTTATGVQFTKGRNENVDVISWEEFEDGLKKRKLAVYNSGGWMKIMKRGK